jgi:hypothetical protein
MDFLGADSMIDGSESDLVKKRLHIDYEDGAV